MEADDNPGPTPVNGGIMVFYPCAPDQLTADPQTNQMIMRAISKAGANLSRDSATTPSGFALMVPSSVVDEYAHSNDPMVDEGDLRNLVDKASGGDGPWVASESKQTQWSPRDAGSPFPPGDLLDQSTSKSPEQFQSSLGSRSLVDQTTGNSSEQFQSSLGSRSLVDQTTEMSPDHFHAPFLTDQSTSTTPPKVCDKFTSCSPTPSTTSTYPDSGVDDSKSVSCQDLVAGGETASSTAAVSLRAKRLSSAETLSTEDDPIPDDGTVEEDEEEDAFLSVNEILGASLVRPIPIYPFLEMADKETSTEKSSFHVLPLRDDIFEGELDPYPAVLRDRRLGMMREESLMVGQPVPVTSLQDDFHSLIDSEDKDEARLYDAGFFCRDAKTDTEDLAWMISIAVGTPDKDGDENAVKNEGERLTASPPLPFKKASRLSTYTSSPATDATVQTTPPSGVCRSAQVSPDRFLPLYGFEESISSQVEQMLSDIVDAVVQDEQDRYPKIFSLDKASDTGDISKDAPDSSKFASQLAYCRQESIDIPAVKKSNKKCQVAETKSFQDASSLTETDCDHLLICPRESVDIPCVKKVNKKQMTERWVQSQCDAFSIVTPQDLTPLSVSPVCIEEYLPEFAIDDGFPATSLVFEGAITKAEETFMTAYESTLPDGDTAEGDRGLIAEPPPFDSGSAIDDAIAVKSDDKEIQVRAETKDAFTKMKKQKVRCVETNTDAEYLPKEPDPRIAELEQKLVELKASMEEKDVYIAHLEDQLQLASEAESERYFTISRLEDSLAESIKDRAVADEKVQAQKYEVEGLLEKVKEYQSFTEKQEEEWQSRFINLQEEKKALDVKLGLTMQAYGELEDMLGRGDEPDGADVENNNNEIDAKDEEHDKRSVFLASRIVDELVNCTFEEQDFPKWAAEKIVADLVSSSLVMREKETLEVGVETAKVKSKSRKTNTETAEYVESGCDPIQELSAMPSLVDAVCDPMEIGCSEAQAQAAVKMVDKFTHMDVQKSRSVSVCTNEIGFADASTSTFPEVSDNASQAEVSTKDKGTSCKVKKSKSKETMTNEAEKADRWTSMSSQTQVKDKGITAALKAPSKSIATSVSRDEVATSSEISTMTEISMTEEASQVDLDLSLLMGVTSFTQYDPEDAESRADAATVTTIFTAETSTQVDAIETVEKAVSTKRIKHKNVASETERPPETNEMAINAVGEFKDAEVNAVFQFEDAEVNAVLELLDAEANAICEVRDAEVTAVCESADKESTTSDLMDPAVDKEIGASEMKADLRKYSDWMIDADCQTQGDVIVPTVDQAVNTEAAAVSDGAIQVKCLVADQSVGPDLAVASRYADAMTSMESSVVCVDNFTEAETTEFCDKDTQVKRVKMKGKGTMTEEVESDFKDIVSSAEVFVPRISTEDEAMERAEEWKAPEELIVAVESETPSLEAIPSRESKRPDLWVGDAGFGVSSSPLPAHGFSRDDDVLSSTVAEEDVSYHTCHQHSPTTLDDATSTQQVEFMQQLSQHKRQQLPFSPSPIMAAVESKDAVTDTNDLEMQATDFIEEEVVPKSAASSVASPRRTSQLVKRLMAPTVASSSKRRSPKPKRKGGKGKKGGIDSPLIVKGIKPSDRPANSQSGSSSSPREGSPDFHEGFKTVMKELEKRMSDGYLPDEDPFVDSEAVRGEKEVVPETTHSPRSEAPRRRFRLPSALTAISSSTPSKIPTPKSISSSIARRRRSPEFDLATAMPSGPRDDFQHRREELQHRRDVISTLGNEWRSQVSTRRRYVGVVRPSRSMETVQEDTIISRTFGDDRLNRTAPDTTQSKSKLQQQIQAEITRRESRRLSRGSEAAPSSEAAVASTVNSAATDVTVEEVTKLDLRHLGQVTRSEEEAGMVEGIVDLASPTGSEDDRRLSARSAKDLEWENEWEVAQQSPRSGRLVASASLDALTADLGFSVHSINDSNTELDVSRFEFLENEIDHLKEAISRRDATLREYRTELEERDHHVDHCNQVLQETQAHYSKLAQENGSLKTEMEKLERVMLMQDEQIVALNMDKNHLQHEIEYKELEHQEVYKFLDDEKKILEDEKRNMEQDKKDLEKALKTAQEELKAICENMAIEEEKFDKQRLINVLEGAESELDSLGEQVAAEQVLKQQLATENKTLKDLLDQARRHSLESIGKIESMEKVLRNRKEGRLSHERMDKVKIQDEETETSPQEDSVLKILKDLVSVAAELKAELLKTPSSCPDSSIYPFNGTACERKDAPHADSGDASSHAEQTPLSPRSTSPSLLQGLAHLHDDLYELKSLLLIYKKEAQDAIGDLVSSNIQLIDEQYTQRNTVAKRLEIEKSQEIENLKKELKDAQKHVKLGKSQIDTFTRSMKKQNERIKDLEDQNRAFELQIALYRDEGRRDSTSFASFPREDSIMDGSTYQESKRLKKEYWRLISKQISDKEHYDRLFGKLTRRMQVLEDNWRKADDEVVLLDGLVQHIRITLMNHLNIIKGCDSLFAMLQELNAVVEAGGVDVNSGQRMELGAASSPADTISTPPTSSQSS